jgi:transposase-like protein
MRTYTQEEKQAVIERVISGEPSARILADTGIPKSTFYSWLRICLEGRGFIRHVQSDKGVR